ncbi:hypothetical protein ABIA32_001542 [Streptacidiphilus sp. MAP12-20]|uniref:hypothetical protein n=1 Tax=Streptacidiphilus sp. MAP12-20 TaxID=3156299 RepID=UPI00351350D3
MTEHLLKIAVGVVTVICSSIAASKIAPRRGANAADWSFIAIFLGPAAIVLLLLFGGKGRKARQQRAGLNREASD